jgi:NADH:ubiquinone oxidoreductase subunit 5 (subunit L)/multisubunit Na+/H+ antiporter MnhA subunit
MISDPHFIRFICYLKLFTVAMLTLVTADNYIMLFVGWECVGLASFLLISFWFTRLQAGKAAIQAMLLNRVGDVGLALGIISLYFCYKTTNYHALFCIHSTSQLVSLFGVNLLDVACILLFIGAMGKSGQFILHAWLPNAMNAPTPVSALLHAATMVKNSCHLIMKIINVNFAICWESHKTNKFVTTGFTNYERCKKTLFSWAYQQEIGLLSLSAAVGHGQRPLLPAVCKQPRAKALAFAASCLL